MCYWLIFKVRRAQKGCSMSKGKLSPLKVCYEGGKIKIEIGVGILAWALQCNEHTWPEGFYIPDLDEYAKDFLIRLEDEEEDGSTPIHHMFDKVAQTIFEQGDISIEEGDVKLGVDVIDSLRKLE